MSDTIYRQDAIDMFRNLANDDWNKSTSTSWANAYETCADFICDLPSAQPDIIRCKDCKLNPKYEWFGCPMSHLSEKQRPETAWCWKAERRTDERSD